MPRLVCDGTAVAPVEVAARPGGKVRGLLGRDGVDGGLLLPGVRGVHTLGMRFAIDVAFVDRNGVVVGVTKMRPWRLGRTRWRSRSVLEAEAGAFDLWGLGVGSRVSVQADVGDLAA